MPYQYTLNKLLKLFSFIIKIFILNNKCQKLIIYIINIYKFINTFINQYNKSIEYTNIIYKKLISNFIEYKLFYNNNLYIWRYNN
jgi:hypothetical protein